MVCQSPFNFRGVFSNLWGSKSVDGMGCLIFEVIGGSSRLGFLLSFILLRTLSLLKSTSFSTLFIQPLQMAASKLCSSLSAISCSSVAANC